MSARTVRERRIHEKKLESLSIVAWLGLFDSIFLTFDDEVYSIFAALDLPDIIGARTEILDCLND